MKRILFAALASLGCVCAGDSSPPLLPVVGRLHVISVHVQDQKSFDKVYLFFRDTLRLPLIYGELSKPAGNDVTLYAGFSAGNAYFEPCGPYKSDAAFSAGTCARFHGLTFTPGESASKSAAELDRRSLARSEVISASPFGEGGGTIRFVYLTDPAVMGKKMAVSIWEVTNKNDKTNPEYLRSSLAAAQGGALGLKRIEEVVVGAVDRPPTNAWQKLAGAVDTKAGVTLAGDGPALRLVSNPEPEIKAVVLGVESLAKARAFLEREGLLGKTSADRVETDPRKTHGLRMILRE